MTSTRQETILIREKPHLERENSFQHFRGLRERADITITKSKSLSFLEYIISLDLDPGIFGIVHRKKVDAGNFVHYFDLELKNPESPNNSVKWT